MPMLGVSHGEWAVPTLRLYAAGADRTVGIWDGAAWTSSVVSVFTAGQSVRSIACTTDGQTVYCRNAAGTIVAKSVDGGLTWASLSIPSVGGFNVQSVGVDAAGRVYLNYVGAVHRSTDGGSSWAEFGAISPKNDSVGLIAFAGTGEIWLPMGNTTDQIAQRFNADGTGQLSVAGTDNFNQGFMAAAPETADRAWLFHQHHADETYRIDLTVATEIDPGQGAANTMAMLDLGAGVALAVCEADSFSTSSSIARSTDNGVTWTTVASGAGYDVATDAVGPLLVASPSSSTTVYYLSNTGLYVSTDNGLTWAAAAGGAIPTALNTSVAVGGA